MSARRLWPPLALLAAGMDPVSADIDYELNLNIENFATVNSVNENSPFNPDNELARIGDWSYDVLFQPRLMGRYDNFRLIALPRLLVTVADVEGKTESNADPYFQEYALQYSGEQISVSAGRELLYWGPAINQSPSNPIYASVNQINPFIEPRARDLARIRYAYDEHWSASFIANYGIGRDKITPEYSDYENIYVAKTDYVGDEFTLAGLYANRAGASWLGLVGQWTVSDAVIAYLDGAVRQGSEALAPRRDSAAPLGWRFTRAHGSSEWLPDILIGGSYTFTDGASLTLEYRYNGQGFNHAQFGDYRALADTASQAAYSSPDLINDSVFLLAQAPNLYARTMGRNYVNLQYLKRDAFVENLSLNFITQIGIDDGGVQLISILSYYLASQWRLNGYVVSNFGGSDTEFGRFLDNSAFFGVTWFSGPITGN